MNSAYIAVSNPNAPHSAVWHQEFLTEVLPMVEACAQLQFRRLPPVEWDDVRFRIYSGRDAQLLAAAQARPKSDRICRPVGETCRAPRQIWPHCWFRGSESGRALQAGSPATWIFCRES